MASSNRIIDVLGGYYACEPVINVEPASQQIDTIAWVWVGISFEAVVNFRAYVLGGNAGLSNLANAT